MGWWAFIYCGRYTSEGPGWSPNFVLHGGEENHATTQKTGDRLDIRILSKLDEFAWAWFSFLHTLSTFNEDFFFSHQSSVNRHNSSCDVVRHTGIHYALTQPGCMIHHLTVHSPSKNEIIRTNITA